MPNWNEVYKEINERVATSQRNADSALDHIRRKYLKRLHKHTGRNTIAYYSGFLANQVSGVELTDEDKNSFMMAIHKMDRTKGLDLILHTPGGSIAAAESLAHYLGQMFGKNIRAIVPQIAMSAGTMLACSCRTILMAKHSNLGPIDPQINGVAAQGVLAEFERAFNEISHDPARAVIWQFVLGKYPPGYIIQCEQAVEWSKDFVKRSLIENMLEAEPEKDAMAGAIVDKLADYSTHKAHNRSIHIEACESLGLKIERLEKTLNCRTWF